MKVRSIFCSALLLCLIITQMVSADLYMKHKEHTDAMAEIMKERNKIKGVVVKSTSSNTIMGQTVGASSELLEIREGKAPDGFFQVPPRYKKTNM